MRAAMGPRLHLALYHRRGIAQVQHGHVRGLEDRHITRLLHLSVADVQRDWLTRHLRARFPTSHMPRMLVPGVRTVRCTMAQGPLLLRICRQNGGREDDGSGQGDSQVDAEQRRQTMSQLPTSD